MKQKKAARPGKNGRMIVSLSPASQATVNYYTGFTGSTPAKVVAQLLQLAHAAFLGNTKTTTAHRQLIVADAELHEASRLHSKRVAVISRKKREVKKSVSAQPGDGNGAS